MGTTALPTESMQRSQAQGDKKPVLGIDVANKQVKSPYRTRCS